MAGKAVLKINLLRKGLNQGINTEAPRNRLLYDDYDDDDDDDDDDEMLTVGDEDKGFHLRFILLRVNTTQ